ncbi:MAG: MarR family winged helix-turn-helix transcriptional regulator [Cyclobacteriaceae bacterium]|nr:MarR family winged helix-turn-helix transcriptional regulator [Cyclobacteriaceae bacterium]
MTEKDIQHIRDFNRFYTNIIGLVDNHILNSAYSLPEARVLYELFHHQPCTASTIMTSINMDKGYLSRVLKSFEKKGLLARKQSKEDGRASTLVLTAKGSKEFESINQASASQIKELLSRLSPGQIKEAIEHMGQLKEILSKASL